jgi:hypothetical protein
MADLLELVELRIASGRWEPGTVGTVVEAFEDGALVEISADGDGRTLDLLSIPHDALRPVEVPEQTHLTV